MNNSRTKYNNSTVRMTAALLRLLDTKTLDKITIRELCEEAGVNRSTFYSHYDTIEDILEETRKVIVDDFVERMDARKKAGLDEDILTAYLELIHRHKNFYKVHMETTSPLNFTEMFKERIISTLEAKEGAGGTPIDENRVQYMVRYYLLGIYAVSKKWEDAGCAESVDDNHSISPSGKKTAMKKPSGEEGFCINAAVQASAGITSPRKRSCRGSWCCSSHRMCPQDG